MRLRHRLEVVLVHAASRVLAWPSLDAAVAFGAAVGKAYARAGLPRTGVARVNLRIAFPALDDAEREAILRDAFANMGRSLVEVLLLGSARRDELLSRVRVEGEANLRIAEAAHASAGVLVLTAHFGTWELAPASMARRGVALSVVERGSQNPTLAATMARWRGADEGVELLRMDAGAAFGVLAALRRGRKLVVALDQNAGREEGVFAPFLGEQACTRSVPAMLAMKRGYAVLPAFVVRDGTNARHVIQLLPPIAIEAAGDDEAEALARNVAAMNRVIEAQIRASPQQWLWAHRRFRTRPAEAAPVGYPVSLRRRMHRAFSRSG